MNHFEKIAWQNFQIDFLFETSMSRTIRKIHIDYTRKLYPFGISEFGNKKEIIL